MLFASGQFFSLVKPYKYKLHLPDINCPHCALQILSIMTDKVVSAHSCNLDARADTVSHRRPSLFVLSTLRV